MRFAFGIGSPPASDCGRWRDADVTAFLAELRSNGGGLIRSRLEVELEGRSAIEPQERFARARMEVLAVRWFPPRLVEAFACGGESPGVGTTILQRCRIGPWLSVDAPLRVVEVVDERWRVAIACATLDGHPERGVERYELVYDPALHRSTLTVEKAWALADPLARVAGPFSRWFQSYATRASLRRFRDGAWS
ncbi:MAG: DUF1990 family protein [Candidatus Limnocylindria bacterium]